MLVPSIHMIAKSTRSHSWVEGTWSKWGSKNKGLGSRRKKVSCKEATQELKPPNVQPWLTPSNTTSGWITFYLHVGNLWLWGQPNILHWLWHWIPRPPPPKLFRWFRNLQQGAWLIYRARWEQAMLGTSRAIVIILGKIGLKNISTYKAVFLKLLSAA